MAQQKAVTGNEKTATCLTWIDDTAAGSDRQRQAQNSSNFFEVT
jgi:hypothetical protein